MNQQRIRLLNSRLDIVRLCAKLGLEVTPTPSGLMVGMCPFHKEKVPSFTIYPHNNSWYSFCCGKGGGSIHLISDVQGRSLDDVLKDYAGNLPLELARKALEESEVSAHNMDALRYAARAVIRDCMRSEKATLERLEDGHRKLEECTTPKELDEKVVTILCDLSKGREEK